MKIVINSNDFRKPIRLGFPTALVLNRLTACFAPMVLKNEDIPITRKQAVRLIKEIKRCKKRFPDWKIVEVKSSDGQVVEIRL